MHARDARSDRREPDPRRGQVGVPDGFGRGQGRDALAFDIKAIRNVTSAGGRSWCRWGGGGPARRGRGRGGGGTSTTACRRRGRCGRPGTRVVSSGGPRTRRRGRCSPRWCTRLSRMAIALRWAGENSRAERPRSRTSPFRPRTTGMIRAWQASRRACSAVIRSPVEVVATPSPGEQGVEVEGDHHAGGGAAMDREAGVGEVLQERHERLPTTPGDRQLRRPHRAGCGGVRCRRPGRSATGSRRGRGLWRAGRWTRPREAGTSAASQPAHGSPRPAAVGTRPRRRSRGRGARGPRGRGGAAPAARTSRPARPGRPPPSTTRSSPRSSGNASNDSTITRACARFTSPAPNASAVCVHRDPRDVSQRRVPAYGPVRSLGSGSPTTTAVDRSPVASAMSSEAARTRSRSASSRP